MLLTFMVLMVVGSAASQGIDDPRSSATDSTTPLRLLHETDCTEQKLCQNGREYLMLACQLRQSFDTETLACLEGETCGGSEGIVRTETAPKKLESGDWVG
jgi:hypothetical protein